MDTPIIIAVALVTISIATLVVIRLNRPHQVEREVTDSDCRLASFFNLHFHDRKDA